MINDTASLLIVYYQANGATSGCLQDAEREFLIAQGATPAHNQDMWFELLRALGYSGALDDMKNDFWCTGGGVVPPSDGIDWDGDWGTQWDDPWGGNWNEEYI